MFAVHLLQDTEYVTFEVFFANGFVLIAVMFLSSFLRSLCHQVHYYIVITESAHIKVAIQVGDYMGLYSRKQTHFSPGLNMDFQFIFTLIRT